ncbi:hypothetical protein BDF14DRAFT_1797015 [Spinellus fusiger]|nr:hypothetical protein BDF14DRAFT_1797015 [Spinellus fusiger]
MDVYTLTRKKRPSHLTLGQSESTDTATTLARLNSAPLPKPVMRGQGVGEGAIGSPSRDHWKPNADSLHCASPDCQTTFGLFERRHHCRKCGDIFCSLHCSNYFRLDHTAQFHPRGVLSRGCDLCASEYQQWQEALVLTKAKFSKKEELKPEEKAVNRRAGIMTQQPQAMEGVTELGREDIVQSDQSSASSSPTTPRPKGIAIKNSVDANNTAFYPTASVPADWQWSTF